MIALAAAWLLVAQAGRVTAAGQAEIVLVGSGLQPAISAGGRFVAFQSGRGVLLVRDFATDTVSEVSVNSSGVAANRASETPEMSADGRFVAFLSKATNLVPRDTNRAPDAFVRDRLSGRTERVSVSSGGSQANRGVAYSNWSPAALLSISANGRYVAFISSSSNLVRGDTNPIPCDYCGDVFVHDRKTDRTRRVNVSSRGRQANWSSATNSRSPTTGASWPFPPTSRAQANPSSSSAARKTGTLRLHQGRRLQPRPVRARALRGLRLVCQALVAGDRDTCPDAFVRDRKTGTTDIVSVTTAGHQRSPDPLGSCQEMSMSMSAAARLVASYPDWLLVPSDTNNHSDVFLRDRIARTTELLSASPDGSNSGFGRDEPAISCNGRFVAFQGDSDDGTPTQIFRRGPLITPSPPPPGRAPPDPSRGFGERSFDDPDPGGRVVRSR